MPHVPGLAPLLAILLAPTTATAQPPEKPWLYATARALPKHTTNQGSGYFALVEGKDGKLYVGTAKYGENAYLVEYDPTTQQMRVVVDCMREIGSKATGFAAQAKIHTRMNVGPSGKVYFGTKQGYPDAAKGEKFADYPGGHPMVYDPATGTTRVYPIPVPHHGVISVIPDEARKVAYVSTCSDERPVESSHFLKLDLETGAYRDLGETNHVYAFIVVDRLGRAYHPARGGTILRYDPKTDRVERLKQTIDGAPPAADSHLADENSHPINWEIDPGRRTLYAVAMSGNQLYAYDLTAAGDTLPGRRLGKLVAAEATDCRALCVSPTGVVWAAVRAKHDARRHFAHLVSYKPGDPAPTDHGPLAVRNPDFTPLADRKGVPFPWHQGFPRFGDGNMVPDTVLLGICATREAQYVLALAPLTLLEVRTRPRPAAPPEPRKPVAGITTVYRHNSHADLILGRLVQTETMDGRGRVPGLRLASLYTDQLLKTDTSRRIMPQMGIPLAKSIPEALTLGGNGIAVEGVMVVAEHGDYPLSPTGAEVYPKRRFFEEVFRTVDAHGRRGLPVFCDKHLADTWADAKWIYDEAKKRDMPLMAGSSLPSAWRSPPVDVPRGAKLKEIHAVSYHRIDVYGFHALEGLQALAERRAGGETGVAAVQTFSGDDVWAAAGKVYDRKLLDATLGALRERPIPPGKRVEELAKKPVLCVIDYKDGLRVCVFTLDGAVAEWAAAWKDDKDKVTGLAFVLQDDRPFSHFAGLVNGVEQLMWSGKAPWPVERTLLTSGVIDECLRSRADGGKRRETPHLGVTYKSEWNWIQPLAPAPPRPPGVQ